MDYLPSYLLYLINYLSVHCLLYLNTCFDIRHMLYTELGHSHYLQATISRCYNGALGGEESRAWWLRVKHLASQQGILSSKIEDGLELNFRSFSDVHVINQL